MQERKEVCPAEGVQHHEYADLLEEAYWEPEALELLTSENGEPLE